MDNLDRVNVAIISAAILAFFVTLTVFMSLNQEHSNTRQERSEIACINQHMTWNDSDFNCTP